MRAASADAAVALDAYLDDYGWRLAAGHDLLEPTVGEQPVLVVATVNACRRQRASAPRPDGTSAMRAAIPEPDRDRFDVLLADARASYALRDDDVGVCWNWPLGLVRRAGLEIARRLADRDLLADPRHLFEADTDEALALSPTVGRPRGGPDAAELARRYGRDGRERRAQPARPPRRWWRTRRGGAAAGGRRSPDGDPRRVVGRGADRVDAPLHGVGIGSQRAVGTARIVRHPDDLIHLVEGDVLVAVSTTTSFNAVFPLLPRW